MVWCGVVWHGMVSFVVWCGVVCGVAWRGGKWSTSGKASIHFTTASLKAATELGHSGDMHMLSLLAELPSTHFFKAAWQMGLNVSTRSVGFSWT